MEFSPAGTPPQYQRQRFAGIKNPEVFTGKDFGIWRRRRDLNPRDGFPPYSLSRGAPSASWVLLQIRYSLIKDVAERVGFEPTDACASPVFKTGSFNRSDISPSWKGAIRRTPDYYTISIGDLSTICSHFYFFNFFHFRGCISRNSMLL